MKKILFVTIDPIEHRRRVLNQIEAAKEAGYRVEAVSLAEFGKSTAQKLIHAPSGVFTCLSTRDR